MITLTPINQPGNYRRRRSRFAALIQAIFFLAGIAGVAIWIWSMLAESHSQREDSENFDEAIQAEQESTDKPAPAKPEPAYRPPANNGVLGRIEIPRLRLTAMVRQGTGDRTLRIAAGHIPGTALPGQPGNVAVAGHRDTLFRGLRNIADDDLIEFKTLQGTYYYRVDRTQVVTPDDVSVLKAHAAPELTLVTCYPFTYIGSAPNRFIVSAHQVSSLAVAPTATASLESEPAPEAPRKDPPVRKPAPAGDPALERIAFEISRGHSRQIAPGISIGLTDTDPLNHQVEAWVWVMPDRRTVWLRSQQVLDPVFFYENEDGKRREVMITSVSADTARGYFVLPKSTRSTPAAAE